MRELTVREARDLREMTQEQLAEASGINQTTISDLETGRHANPRLDTIQRLAEALGIAPSKLRFSAPKRGQSVTKNSDSRGQARERRVS